MAKGLTILLLSGSMMSMEGNVATKLAEAAFDKGYKVNLFLFGEAITAAKTEQAPKRFPNLGGDLEKLIGRGLKISICGTCSEARGLGQADMIKGAKIGSLTNDFSAFLEESDRLVTLGR